MSRLLLSLMDISLKPFCLNNIYSEMRNEYEVLLWKCDSEL
jgi:hypothetical protein